MMSVYKEALKDKEIAAKLIEIITSPLPNLTREEITTCQLLF